jgi:hypothetical protein
MTVYLVIERPDENGMFLCGPHDKLKAACISFEAIAQALSEIDFTYLRIEKHECKDLKIGKPIFVLFRHPEPNGCFLDNHSQVEKLQTREFSQDEQTSKCDMAYSLESVECILK